MKKLLLAIALFATVACDVPPEAAPVEEIKQAWVNDPYDFYLNETIYLNPRWDAAIRSQHPATAALTCPVMRVTLTSGSPPFEQTMDQKTVYPTTYLCTNPGTQTLTTCRCAYVDYSFRSAFQGTHKVKMQFQCSSGGPFSSIYYRNSTVSLPSSYYGTPVFSDYGPLDRKGTWRSILNNCGADVGYYDGNTQVCVMNGSDLVCTPWP